MDTTVKFNFHPSSKMFSIRCVDGLGGYQYGCIHVCGSICACHNTKTQYMVL